MDGRACGGEGECVPTSVQSDIILSSQLATSPDDEAIRGPDEALGAASAAGQSARSERDQSRPPAN